MNQYQFQWRDLSFMALAGGSLNESPLHTATFDQNHIHSINRQPPGVAGVSKDSMLAEEV